MPETTTAPTPAPPNEATPEQPKLPTPLPPTFTEHVRKLATDGHLVAYIPTTNEQPAPPLWEAGKLFQIINTNAHEVTPVLALGHVGEQLLAVTLHPTKPQAILISPQEATEPTTVIKTPLAGGPNSVAGASKAADPKPFITKHRGNTLTTFRALPIQPQFLHHFFTDNQLHHPATLHGYIARPPETPNCDPTALWLQCATTRHPENEGSTLAIATTALASTLTQRASDTIRNDLEELLSNHADQLLQSLETSHVITPSVTPDPEDRETTGHTQPKPTERPPTPPPAHQPTTSHPQPAPARRLLFKEPDAPQDKAPPPPHPNGVIDLTGGQPNGPTHHHTWPQPPQGAPWAPSQWQPPTLQPPTPFMQHPPTTFPNPAYLPPPPQHWPQTRGLPPPQYTTMHPHYQPVTRDAPPQWHRPAPNTGPSLLSTKEMAQNRIRALLDKQTKLTTEELLQIHTFTQVQNSTQSHTHAPTIHSDRIYALLGFAGLTPESTEWFHQQTNSLWRDMLTASSKAGRERIVQAEMAHTLCQYYPTLKPCLHQEWIKTVSNFDFAPQPLPPGEKHGLGPMAYVPRTKAALHEANYQRDLLSQASQVSTSDIAKAKLNTPIVPKGCADVIAALSRMRHVLYFLFTSFCPLARQVDTIIRALEEDSGTLSESDDFQWGIGAEIMWQVTVATQAFFEHPCSRRDHEVHRYHHPDLSRLRAAIGDGTIVKSLNKAPMFRRPTSNNRQRNNTPRESGKRRRTSPQKDNDTPPANTQPLVARLSQECANIITKFRNDHRDTRLPSIAQVRQLAGVQYDAELISQLGLQRNDCIRYHFYGRCSYPGCARIHQHRATSDKHATLLTKALAQAVASKS